MILLFGKKYFINGALSSRLLDGGVSHILGECLTELGPDHEPYPCSTSPHPRLSSCFTAVVPHPSVEREGRLCRGEDLSSGSLVGAAFVP
jgi:hypothetical protein